MYIVNSWDDFGFDRRTIKALSSAGTSYFREIWCGMPRIPPNILNTTFYLYKSRKDAESGHPNVGGGTGLFLAVLSKNIPDFHHLFALTNWHVAVKGKCSVIRVNKKGGGTDIFEYDPSEWIYQTDGHDLAIIPAPTINATHDVGFLNSSILLTKDAIQNLGIGPGEDIFMFGRFVDHDGGETNMPAVRFGNISMMPWAKIKQGNGAKLESYCLDVHSRTGFSGSPVFVYRTAASDLTSLNSIQLGGNNQFMALLGLHWGQFPEKWEIRKEAKKSTEANEPHVAEYENYVQGMSGMTLAAPSWAILDLLEHEKVQKIIAEREDEEIRRRAKQGMPPVAETA